MLPERMIVRYKLHSKEDFIDLRIRSGNSISYPSLQLKAKIQGPTPHTQRCCYITVDYATDASQNGVYKTYQMCHIET